MNVDFFNSGKSVLFLQKKCRKILRSELGLSLHIPTEPKFEWHLRRELQGTRDVLLLGDALLLLTNSYLWPKTGEFRFWVLSEAHKNLIGEIVGIDEKHISVIPRDLIVERKTKAQALPNFSKPSTFVISSRIDEDKNIPFTFHLANALQDLFPLLRVVIFSPSKNKLAVKECIDQFSWKRRPRFLGDRGFHWHKSVKLAQPFLVNLSTYPMEDFSVSTAQAQELGWPLVLSNWAVFREIHGPSVLKISANDILRYKKKTIRSGQERIIQSVLKDLLRGITEKRLHEGVVQKLKVPVGISGAKLMKLQKAWTHDRRNKLIEAHMEPKKRTNNQEYKKIRELLS